MSDYKELLQLYIDGQIDDIDRILLEEHLKFCQDCQRELKQLIVLDWHLKSANEIIDIPEELHWLRSKAIKTYFLSNDQERMFSVGDLAKIQYSALQNVFISANYLPGRKIVHSFIRYAGKTLGKTAKKKLGSFRFWPVPGAGG